MKDKEQAGRTGFAAGPMPPLSEPAESHSPRRHGPGSEKPAGKSVSLDRTRVWLSLLPLPVGPSVTTREAATDRLKPGDHRYPGQRAFACPPARRAPPSPGAERNPETKASAGSLELHGDAGAWLMGPRGLHPRTGTQPEVRRM